MREAKKLAVTAALAASDKKAKDILIMDMRGALGITDYFVICSGNTERQVRRIAESIEERLKGLEQKPFRREGEAYFRWVRLDYMDIVVHIFREEERNYYALERLWADVPLVEWQKASGKSSGGDG